MLTYYGMFASNHSWGTVANSLLLELHKRQKALRIFSTNGYAPANFQLLPLCPEINQKRLKVLPTQYGIGYTIPPNLTKMPSVKRLHIYNYDGTILPPGWANLINNHVSLLLPSSTFAKEIFIQNGVDPNKVEVLPHGYDPVLYNPNIKPALINNIPTDKFKFLSIAIPHWRKGYDILLKAYIEEFSADENVALIIKTNLNTRETGPCIINLMKLIEDTKSQYSSTKIIPQINIVSQYVDNIASLYRAVNCVVLPSRFECFSLTMLEATACKIPVITTNYGGHLDFLNQDNSNLVNCSKRTSPREGQYWHFNPTSECAEPDKNHLRILMRDVFNNYQNAQVKADSGYQAIVEQYSWSNVAEQLLQILSKRGMSI